MANIENKVEALITKTIEGLGYELYDVIYEKEAQDYYLRIFIDTPEGISIEDCEKVNDAITDMLDEADYIKEQYFLEISSPGIERLLRKDKHLQANIGKEITCNLYYPITINDNKEENSKTEDEESQKNIKKKKNKTQKNNCYKQLEGVLKDFTQDKLTLQIQLENQKELTEIEIERKNISNTKLKYDWN